MGSEAPLEHLRVQCTLVTLQMEVLDPLLDVVKLRVVPGLPEARLTRTLFTLVAFRPPRFEETLLDISKRAAIGPQQRVVIWPLTVLVEILAPKNNTSIFSVPFISLQ